MSSASERKPLLAVLLPGFSKPTEEYWRVEGSGESVKDPMIMWMVRPTGCEARNQGITDSMRELAYITKQQFVWIRSHDHATTRIEDNDRERWYVPCHPHITVYTSEDPTYYRLEGHAYITYSDEGIPCGLASRDELGEHHSNPELHVYHKQLPVKFSEMAAEPQLENRMMDICTDIRCHMYSDDPEWPRMHSRSMCRLHRGRSDTASTNSSSNASPNSSPCASPGSSN